jgi:hypothetical protein
MYQRHEKNGACPLPQCSHHASVTVLLQAAEQQHSAALLAAGKAHTIISRHVHALQVDASLENEIQPQHGEHNHATAIMLLVQSACPPPIPAHSRTEHLSTAMMGVVVQMKCNKTTQPQKSPCCPNGSLPPIIIRAGLPTCHQAACCAVQQVSPAAAEQHSLLPTTPPAQSRALPLACAHRMPTQSNSCSSLARLLTLYCDALKRRHTGHHMHSAGAAC